MVETAYVATGIGIGIVLTFVILILWDLLEYSVPKSPKPIDGIGQKVKTGSRVQSRTTGFNGRTLVKDSRVTVFTATSVTTYNFSDFERSSWIVVPDKWW